jgi:predicted nucleic acid-binding protein
MAGLQRAERYGLSVYDGLVVAARRWKRGARRSGRRTCNTALVIDKRLKILNPFVDGETSSP